MNPRLSAFFESFEAGAQCCPKLDARTYAYSYTYVGNPLHSSTRLTGGKVGHTLICPRWVDLEALWINLSLLDLECAGIVLQ